MQGIMYIDAIQMWFIKIRSGLAHVSGRKHTWEKNIGTQMSTKHNSIFYTFNKFLEALTLVEMNLNL